MTQQELVWTLIRGATRLELLLFETDHGTIEAAVMNGAMRVATGRPETRDLGRVWAEHMRQEYLADGWREDDSGG